MVSGCKIGVNWLERSIIGVLLYLGSELVTNQNNLQHISLLNYLYGKKSLENFKSFYKYAYIFLFLGPKQGGEIPHPLPHPVPTLKL